MTDPDGTSVILATKTKKDVSHFRTSSQEVTDFFVWETSTRVKLMGLPPTHTHTQKKTLKNKKTHKTTGLVNSWGLACVPSPENLLRFLCGLLTLPLEKLRQLLDYSALNPVNSNKVLGLLEWHSTRTNGSLIQLAAYDWAVLCIVQEELKRIQVLLSLIFSSEQKSRFRYSSIRIWTV